MLLLLSAASLLGAPYQVLMPLFAADVLHGNAHTLGILTAASGVGAISGALYLASRRSVVGLGRILVLSAGCFGLSLVGFSLARHVWGAVLALIGASGGMMVLTTSSNILLQTIVEEEKRGRVMSRECGDPDRSAPDGTLRRPVLPDRSTRVRTPPAHPTGDRPAPLRHQRAHARRHMTGADDS